MYSVEVGFIVKKFSTSFTQMVPHDNRQDSRRSSNPYFP